MPTPLPPRFSLKNGQIFDGGVQISPVELQAYLQRQQQAVDHNASMGPIGGMANKLLLPEMQNAQQVQDQITNIMMQRKGVVAPSPAGVPQR